MDFDSARRTDSVSNCPSPLAGLSILCLWALVATPAFAQVGVENTKLSEFQTRRGAVEEAQRSADGQHVVYRASQEAADRIELFVVPAAGGVVTKLNQVLVDGGDVLDFEISPDSTTVAFLADADDDEKRELYRVPITGGSVTRVNGPMVPGGDVDRFRFTDDSSHVVYSATQRHFQIEELFSHALAGGAVSMLSPQLAIGSEVVDFGFSPDSSRVVFIVADPDDGDLYSAPIGGGGATQLGDPPSLPDDIRQFEVLADNTTVLFTRAMSSVQSELLSTTITGGATTAFGPAGMIVRERFGLTPDESRLVLEADFKAATGELFSINLTTEDFTLLSGTSSGILNFYLSPDSQHVVFTGQAFSGPQLFDGLAIVPVTGGSVLELAPDTFSLERLEFSPDGSRILYRTETGVGGLNEIFSVPADGSTPPVNLVPQVVEDGARLAEFDTTADNVLFWSDHGASEVFEVYTVPWNGGPITRLSDPLVEGGAVDRVFFDGDTVLYWADQEAVGLVELFTVASTGGAVTKLNPPFLGTAGRVSMAALSPDEGTAVFLADQNTFGQPELWGYDLDGDGPAVQLSEAPFPDSEVTVFSIVSGEAESEHVVFRASRDSANVFGIYSTPPEGGPVVQLDNPADGSTGNPRVTPNGPWVVYEAADERMFRTGVEGSDVLLLLDLGTTPRFRLSLDGQFVVYIDADDQLMAVPIETGGPIQLSSPDQTLVDRFQTFAITPDSSRVVYRAFSAQNNRTELYSVPILGGPIETLSTSVALCNTGLPNDLTPVFTPDSSRVLVLCGPNFFPTLHSMPLTGGPIVPLIDGNDHGNFGFFRVSPDSSYVVARFFGPNSNTRLVGMPIDGGEETLFFSVPSGQATLGIGDFQFSADSSALVFIADDDPGLGDNLYTSPLVPGAVTQVNPDGNVADFEIAPDSSRIFYTATPFFFDFPTTADLVSAPLTGGPILAHHPPSPVGRFSRIVRVGSDGRSVLYTSDREQEDTFELYHAVTTLLFLDGFESGDTSLWSSVQP